MATLVRFLTALLRRTPPAEEPLADSELLNRFTAHRDATAFELLVWRHGAMVLGVCRRMLRHDHTAEDAFQATFLILAKKAGGVRGRLAGWLHTTARRVCLRIAKRPTIAALEAEPPAAVPPDVFGCAELQALLDSEIARLPEKFRLAVILCYLRGLTTEDAATQLGIPKGTVLSRLASARKRLIERLTAKGITVPAAFLATAVMSPELTADIGAKLAATATSFLGGELASLPAQLATEVLTMANRKIAATTIAALMLLTGVGTGVGWGLAFAESDKPGDAPKPTAKAELPKAAPEKAKPKPEVEPKRQVDEKAAMRDRLVQQREALDMNIRQLEAKVERFTADSQKLAARTGSAAERKANEELLAEVAKQVFAAETSFMEAKFELDEAARAYQPISNRKAELEKLRVELKDIERQESDRRIELDKLAKVFAADSPKLMEAKAKLDAIQQKHTQLQSRYRKVLESGPYLEPSRGGWGAASGPMSTPSVQSIKQYEQQLVDEEAKRVAVERGESTIRVKRQKLEYLKEQQEALRNKLSNVPEATKAHEAALESTLAELRTYREMLTRVNLEIQGFTTPAPRADDKLDRILNEIEELRREVQKLRK